MQIGPRIRFDSHTLGNAIKNLSPALAFTPAGLVGTAIAAGGGELLRGKHGIGDLARSVGSNVAIGAGARGLAGHFGVLGQGGPAAAPVPESTTYTQSPTGGYVDQAGARVGGVGSDVASPVRVGIPASAGSASDAANAGGSTLGTIGHGFGKLAGFAADHPSTTAQIGSALGSLATSGARNRQTEAQTRLLDLQAQMQEQELQRQKASAQLDPLRGAIYGKLFENIGAPITPNPYVKAGA